RVEPFVRGAARSPRRQGPSSDAELSAWR
nr:rel protein - chicken [Gallus gallus]